MAGREFEWVDYEIAVPASSMPQMRALGIEPTAAAIEAAGPGGMTTVMVPLPKLTKYPTPQAKAQILLESAAEIEHALLVQYLYAAYSLKDPGEVDDAVQQELLKSWRKTLVGIAREEMGHLMTVQNLLMLLNLGTNFEREDCPPRTDLYPFPLVLEPLTQSSLAKYVVAEAPWDAAGLEDITRLATGKAGAMINHVGILYGLLGLVFCCDDQLQAGATGHPHWDEIVRMIAEAAQQQQPLDRWHLPDAQFHSETIDRQANPDVWEVFPGLRVHQVGDRTAASQAIRDIGEQGEGPSSGDEIPHFQRFLDIFTGTEGRAGFPGPGSWVPTRPVPTGPTIDAIGDSRTQDWARLADTRYALLLGFLGHYLASTGDPRDTFTGWIFDEMRHLRSLTAQLTAMPLNDEPGGPERAALTFTLPPQPNLPGDEAARRRLHRDRLTEAIAIAARLREGETTDIRKGILEGLLSEDRARLETMDEHSPPPVPAGHGA